MKFVVERDSLVDAVNWVARSLSSRPIQTSLLGILLEVDKEIALTGSDSETTTKAHIEAQISQGGEVLVPGRLLAEIVRSLPAKPITFQLDGSRVLVTAGSAKFTLPTLPVNEYPTLPSIPPVTGHLPAEVFAEAISQVVVAAGRDDSLPNLTGVHVEITNNAITLAATDRYRLAVKEINWSAKIPNFETTTLLRARTLSDAERALAGSADVEIAWSSPESKERLVGFISDEKTMTTRIMDGTLPPFRHLFPKDVTSEAIVDVAALLDAVHRVAIVTDKTVPLRLSFADNSLQLEAGAGNDAQATEVLEIQFSGPEINIAFNPTFLTDGLNALGTNFVHFGFTAGNKPAVMMGKNEIAGAPNESFKYLLMPMRF